MQDFTKAGVSVGKTISYVAGAFGFAAMCVAFAYGATNRIDKVEISDALQDARLAKLEEFREKANEAIITTPIKLDSLSKSIAEIKTDVKTYLITK